MRTSFRARWLDEGERSRLVDLVGWLDRGGGRVFVFPVVRDAALVDWGTDLLPLRLGWVGLAS